MERICVNEHAPDLSTADRRFQALVFEALVADHAVLVRRFEAAQRSMSTQQRGLLAKLTALQRRGAGG